MVLIAFHHFGPVDKTINLSQLVAYRTAHYNLGAPNIPLPFTQSSQNMKRGLSSSGQDQGQSMVNACKSQPFCSQLQPACSTGV